jgi:hypothetical protein
VPKKYTHYCDDWVKKADFLNYRPIFHLILKKCVYFVVLGKAQLDARGIESDIILVHGGCRHFILLVKLCWNIKWLSILSYSLRGLRLKIPF